MGHLLGYSDPDIAAFIYGKEFRKKLKTQFSEDLKTAAALRKKMINSQLFRDYLKTKPMKVYKFKFDNEKIMKLVTKLIKTS